MINFLFRRWWVSLLAVSFFVIAGFQVIMMHRASVALQQWTQMNVQEPARDIPIHDSVWIEELTWIEVRDLIATGKTIALLPTGGIEQNGPYVVNGKHNLVVRAISDRVARILGNALVAPVLGFVPEGALDPPTGHMLFPGTIGLSAETFEQVLYEICLSLKNAGFSDIVILGDSGGNQAGQERVANRFNKQWGGDGIRAHHLKEYYEFDKWGYEQLKELGIFQVPDVQSAQRGDVHSDFYYESILAFLDPALIRRDQRVALGKFEINGVSLEPLARTQEVGRKLMEARAQSSAAWIRQISAD